MSYIMLEGDWHFSNLRAQTRKDTILAAVKTDRLLTAAQSLCTTSKLMDIIVTIYHYYYLDILTISSCSSSL